MDRERTVSLTAFPVCLRQSAITFGPDFSKNFHVSLPTLSACGIGQAFASTTEIALSPTPTGNSSSSSQRIERKQTDLCCHAQEDMNPWPKVSRLWPDCNKLVPRLYFVVCIQSEILYQYLTRLQVRPQWQDGHLSHPSCS